jgi:TusA-related sulfurtransferase
VSDPRPEADALLEAYGQTCVMLEPLIKARMRSMSSGEVLEVRADDPTARLGVPSWSRLSGNALLAVVDAGAGRTCFYLRKK